MTEKRQIKTPAARRNWTEAQAITAHNTDSRALLGLIEKKLDYNDQAVRDGYVNWGHAGDAENYRRKLLDLVVAFTIGADQDEAECEARILALIK
jgi:hypothetical protein